MAEGSTARLASWVADLNFSSLDDSTVDAAVKSFTNYVGCVIGGSQHEATQKALSAFSGLAQGPEACSLLGSSKKTDPLQAALVNGLACHIHDYDDTHLSTVIHPTAAVASALLAYIEASGEIVSGKEFVTALVAGIEVECLLGVAVYPSHYDRGWHITASVGSIGAAIAVGKAMKMTQEQLVNAIGIASTQVNGMRIHFGSHAKPLGVGFAAQSGLQSAYLALGGMTAASNSLEGPRAWIECVCPDPKSAYEKLPRFVNALTQRKGIDGDGKTETAKNTFKPYPCGIVIHPIIDGCSQLREEGVDVEQIEHIELTVHPLVLELTGRKDPKDGLQAKFSVYFGAACGLLFGKATPAEYTDEIVKQTSDLRSKTEATIDDTMRPDECHIVIRSRSGTIEKHVDHAVGSLTTPMSDKQFQQKFLDQTGPVIGSDRSLKLFESLSSILDAPNIISAINA